MNTLKRQGDVLLERIGSSLEDVDCKRYMEVEDGVIAKGEVTGHAHKLEDGVLYNTSRGMVAVVDEGETGRVVHEEHGTIELEDGVWLVHRQTEYVSPDETAQVYD